MPAYDLLVVNVVGWGCGEVLLIVKVLWTNTVLMSVSHNKSPQVDPRLCILLIVVFVLLVFAGFSLSCCALVNGGTATTSIA